MLISQPELLALRNSRTQITEMHLQRGAKISSASLGYYVVLLAIGAFSVWLRMGFPVFARPEMVHDDQLFVRLARYLEAGRWLGPYDNLTLAKGMVYPLFIDIAFWTGVPLKLAEQVIYLIVCALTVTIIRHRLRKDWFSVCLFALLAFNPVVWNLNSALVLRQGLYMSLSLAVVVLVLAATFPLDYEPNSRLCRVGTGASLGLATAAYWLTREEGVWLVPACAIIVALAVLGILHSEWTAADRTSFRLPSVQLKAIALSLAVALITFTATDWLVAALNYRYYGIFETNEFRAQSFLRAYGALSRIQHDHWRYLVPFPKDARERAYLVSPAARELANWLEGPTGKKWLGVTCFYGDPKICATGEVQAGWEMWEFRDAVADAGHYRTGKEAMSYYRALADQIDSACDRGLIPCLPPRATLVPPFRLEYLGGAAKASKAIALVLFKMVDSPVGSATSVGSAEGIAMFADTIDDIYLPENGSLALWGWAASPLEAPSLHIIEPVDGGVRSSIKLSPATDVVKVMPNLKAVRFEIRSDCPISQCYLALDLAGNETKVPFSQLIHPNLNRAVIEGPQLKLYVDGIVGPNNNRFRDMRRSLQVKIAGLLASIYAAVFPTLGVFGALGLLLTPFLLPKSSIPTSLLALGAGSAAAVGTLTVLMSYVAASSGFPVANILYTSPGSPFVIVFTAIGLYALCTVIKSVYQRLFGSEEAAKRVGHINFHEERPVNTTQE